MKGKEMKKINREGGDLARMDKHMRLFKVCVRRHGVAQHPDGKKKKEKKSNEGETLR
jgi:hypothetical protein